MCANVTPIFVLGTPRSGTTVIGKYLSTHNKVLDMGEYAGYDFTYRVAPNLMKTLPSVFKNEYLISLQQHADQFAQHMAIKNDCHYFCDSTPWTLLTVDKMKERLENAKVILCIREPQGVIQSLERSFNNGKKWAGSNNQERFDLWKSFYEKVKYIPKESLIVFNYSKFCNNPDKELSKLDKQLNQHGIAPELLNKGVFTESHATVQGDRRPVSARVDEDGKVILLPKEDWKKGKWTNQDDTMLKDDSQYSDIIKILNQVANPQDLHPAIIYKHKHLSSFTNISNTLYNTRRNVR